MRIIIVKERARTRPRPMIAWAAALAAAALALTSCAGANTPAGPTGDRPSIVVTLYAVEFLAAEISGDEAQVVNVVPTGAEPHDVELSPRDVFRMESADLVVTVAGFQPAVDAATSEFTNVLNLADSLDLQVREGALDPHFWLDPERMVVAAEELTAALSTLDAEHAGDYRDRADALIAQLTSLDAEFRDGLAQCEHHAFVTGHAAFGYLADAYGLREIAVAGIDPDTEPSTAALAATREEIRGLGLPMVFAEPGETKIAEVLAAELGINTRVLDPIEAVRESEDYLSLMSANLEALREGLQCR